MNVITRQVDQAVAIGHSVLVAPTDIDEQTVRLIAHGHVIGGPGDGETFRSVHELSKGQSVQLGPLVTVTVVEILGDAVRLGVLAPPHLPVLRQEMLKQRDNPA